MLPLLFLLSLAIHQVAAVDGCVCNQTTDVCSCCAGVPNMPFLSVCAEMEWIPATGDIDATITFSGTPFAPVVFNNSFPQHCLTFSQNPPTSGCFDLKNYTIQKNGACGEFFVELKIFFDIEFPLGVFHFGDTGNFVCPDNPYPPPPSTFKGLSYEDQKAILYRNRRT